MGTNVGISFGFIFVLLGAALLVLLVVRGRGHAMAMRRARKRHIITRLICGAAGVGILIAVGIGTWVQIEASGARIAAATGTSLHLPTQPPPEIRKDTYDPNTPVRFLFHILLVDSTTGEARILEAREMDSRLSDAGTTPGSGKDCAFRIGRREVGFSLCFDSLNVTFDGNGAPVFNATGDNSISVRAPDIAWGDSLYNWAVEDQYVTAFPVGDRFRRTDPLSVVPQGSEGRGLRLLLLVDRVTLEDPLKKVSLSEFAKARADRIGELLAHARSYSLGSGRARWGAPEPRGLPGIVMLARFVGPAGLLLAVAAGLLAQLFVRRPLALAGLLAVMVLYVAGMDRLVLRKHLSVARDTNASVVARIDG